MKYIGAHVSITGGVSNAPVKAHTIGAKAFALFTGSSSRWVSKEISQKRQTNLKRIATSWDFPRRNLTT